MAAAKQRDTLMVREVDGQNQHVVDVHQLAHDLFIRNWHAGHADGASEHVAAKCFKAALAFAKVAERIRGGATPDQAATDKSAAA